MRGLEDWGVGKMGNGEEVDPGIEIWLIRMSADRGKSRTGGFRDSRNRGGAKRRVVGENREVEDLRTWNLWIEESCLWRRTDSVSRESGGIRIRGVGGSKDWGFKEAVDWGNQRLVTGGVGESGTSFI
jgi:hypothetical protein